MSEDFALKATLKEHGGYDASWLTVGADDPTVLEQRIDGVSGDLLGKITDLAAQFRAAGEVTKAGATPGAPAPVPHPVDNLPQQQATPQTVPAAPPAQQVPAQQAPVQQQASTPGVPKKGDPHPEGKRCELDGELLVLKAGVSAKGPWANYSCPRSRRGDNHPTEWLSKDFANVVAGS